MKKINEKKWDGTTDSGSRYFALRQAGASHDEAVARIEGREPASWYKTEAARERGEACGIMDIENSDLTAAGLIAKMAVWDEAEHGVPANIYDATEAQLKIEGIRMPKIIRRIGGGDTK